MKLQLDMNTQKALQSLAQRKPNSTISIAADLANDNVNSICRIALAWITDGNVHGISYLIKPPTPDFTSRKVTADMVADSKPFAVVWDTEIKPLLHDEILSAYRSEQLFLAIKASYETGGHPFKMDDVYVRDLRFLASTYIPDLGNDSFVSIMHFMKIPVDLDNALSRAMACICSLDWLEKLYPVSNYGIPLSAIMAGALCPQTMPLEPEEAAALAEAQQQKYDRLNHYAKVLFIPFLILCVFLTLYYVQRYTEQHRDDVDFSAYKITEAITSSTVKNAVFKPSANHQYTMQRATYVIVEPKATRPFIQAMKTENLKDLQRLIQNDEVIVFMEPTKVEVTGNGPEGFVTIKILEGVFKDKTGITPIVMVNK